MANHRVLVLALLLAVLQCLLPCFVSAAPFKLTGTSDPSNRAAQNSFIRQLVDPIPALYGTEAPQVVKGSPIQTTRTPTTINNVGSSTITVGANLESAIPVIGEGKPRHSMAPDVRASVMAVDSSLLAAAYPILPRVQTIYKDGVPVKTLPEGSVLTFGPKRSAASSIDGDDVSRIATGVATSVIAISDVTASPSLLFVPSVATPLSLGEGKPSPGLPSDGQLSFRAEPTKTSLSLGEGKPFPGLPSNGQLSFRAEPTPTSPSLGESKPFPGLPSDGQLSLGASSPTTTSLSLGQGKPSPGIPAQMTPTPVLLGESKPSPGIPSNVDVSNPVLPRHMVIKTIYPSMNTSLPAVATVKFEVPDKRNAAVATSTLANGEVILLPTIHFDARRAVTTAAVEATKTVTATGVGLLGPASGFKRIYAMPGPVVVSEGLEPKTSSGV
ncbi:MAG: hypothetical protein M1836_000722 [Candelina mexicana]|nr:MAG: hypothetical protein M1836_000722 [Candelina mexicana]